MADLRKGIFACTALGGGMKWHGIGLDATWRLASSDSPREMHGIWPLLLRFENQEKNIS